LTFGIKQVASVVNILDRIILIDLEVCCTLAVCRRKRPKARMQFTSESARFARTLSTANHMLAAKRAKCGFCSKLHVRLREPLQIIPLTFGIKQVASVALIGFDLLKCAAGVGWGLLAESVRAQRALS
jgi:hypothetical protein